VVSSGRPAVLFGRWQALWLQGGARCAAGSTARLADRFAAADASLCCIAPSASCTPRVCADPCSVYRSAAGSSQPGNATASHDGRSLPLLSATMLFAAAQVFGLCIGLLQAAGPKTHAFTATLQMWMGIDPHLLLLIFLPTIGFSAALGQEPHLLRRNWGQVKLCACEGRWGLVWGLFGPLPNPQRCWQHWGRNHTGCTWNWRQGGVCVCGAGGGGVQPTSSRCTRHSHSLHAHSS
jgi:hypothetical protein